jgi:Fe-S oxidoreductase
VPQHICEVTYDLIQRGALKFDKSANDDKVVTFHDSCNVARASRMGNMPGGQFIIPRAVVKASVNKFIDMPPDTIFESTYCCGGGGGVLTDELLELRVKGTAPRMQALKQVVEEHGVTHIAAICAICKAQFTKVLPYYKFPMDMIQSTHGLVSKAIQLGAVNQ